MSRQLGIVLLIWNIVLSVLVGWSFMRTASAASELPDVDGAVPDSATTVAVATARDTNALAEASIAYFFMDTLRAHMDLLQERTSHYKSEGRRLESQWQNELAKAQGEANQLTSKDHTYNTKAELEADRMRLAELDEKIGELKMKSEERMAKLEMDILAEVSTEIESFLKEYNETRGFDYIISVEAGGQVWVGNADLDISHDIIAGMNAKHQAKKAK